MRIGLRLVLLSTALALVFAAGCKGVTPPSLRENEPSAPSAVSGTGEESSTESSRAAASESTAPVKPTSGEYASSLTSAGVAVGAELQHTEKWLLGGKVWAMTIDGKPDDVTDKPKVQVIAVNVTGARTVIAEIPASQAKGAATIQGTIQVPIPSKTVRLLIATSLRAPGAGDGPTLDVDLNEVPVVKALSLVEDAE